MKPGPTNSLVDVAGLRVGHTHRIGDGYRTGTTVILPPPEGMVAGVDVRGAAPGTRETELLDPRNLVERVHAVVLTGGSAYGLAAATGVVARLARAGIGFPVTGGVVPIVPAAVIFDLGRGGTFEAVPDESFGAAAYDAASDTGLATASGSIGAGAGAVAGGLAGGIGTASAVLPDGTTVAALTVANPHGSVLDPASARLAGTRYGLPGEFDHVREPSAADFAAWRPPTAGSFNTTIGVVATDAALSKAQCGKLAGVAHDGLARAIRPAHTMVDGDTIFGLATCGRPAPGPEAFQDVLAVAADVFARAVAHAVLAATGRDDAPAYTAAFPTALGDIS